MAEYVQLKFYFGKDLAKLLADKIKPEYPEFKSRSFITRVAKSVDDQELKQRVETITDALQSRLPGDYSLATDILMNILGPENKQETGMFKEYYWVMPIAFFVEKYGLDDFKQSMKMIEAITKRNTGEYAIRPFIIKYPDKTLAVMKRWSKSKNVHLRRLASEGLRPRLPWAKKLTVFCDDPAPVLELLDNLKSDPSAFVRKSVANHLNDLLKENNKAAFALLNRWNKNASPETKWIIKHALRNELKKLNPKATTLVK